MSIALIKKDIESGNIPAIYLLYGEDRYSLVEALKLLKKVFLEEDESGSGLEYFYGKDVSPETITEAANTASFFSRRLVIVDDIPYFSQSKNKNDSKSEENTDEDEQVAKEAEEGGDTTILLEYCQKPNPSTCLVLMGAKANKGRKLFKEIAKTGKIIEFSNPRGPAEWMMWVQNEAKIRGKSISPSNAAFLVEWAGHHPGVLTQELDKLVSYLGDKSDIKKEDITRVCIPLVETTIFAMLDAIAAGNSQDALQKLKEVLSQEHYLKVQTMIVRQIRLLLAGTLVRKRGEKVENLIIYTKIKPYEGNKVFRQAANFSSEKLALAMEECLQTDMALKRSGDPHLLMEMMVLNLCSKINSRQ